MKAIQNGNALERTARGLCQPIAKKIRHRNGGCRLPERNDRQLGSFTATCRDGVKYPHGRLRVLGPPWCATGANSRDEGFDPPFSPRQIEAGRDVGVGQRHGATWLIPLLDVGERTRDKQDFFRWRGSASRSRNYLVLGQRQVQGPDFAEWCSTWCSGTGTPGFVDPLANRRYRNMNCPRKQRCGFWPIAGEPAQRHG